MMGDLRSAVFGARDNACSAPQVLPKPKHPYSHVDVMEESNGDVTLTTANRSVRWNSEGGFWGLSWLWSAEGEPTWIKRAWLALVAEEEAVPICVLSLIAQVQEHKVSTPVP